MSMAQKSVVTVIPPKIIRGASGAIRSMTSKRVAGYARVSTDADDQLNSYAAQVEYYTDYIKNHAGWTFVEVYADEGLSGTSRKNRKNFNRMIDDAMDGKIDLIITNAVIMKG